MPLHGVKIIGTGSYLPEKIVTNHDLEKLVETSDDWITERTGIKERRVSAPDEPTSMLAEKAARRAMEMAGVTIDELDLIICATMTPDTRMPNTGCQLQARLGAKRCPAFSIEVACSGFLYALKIASDMIRCGTVKTVLVAEAEELSKVTDWTDRNTCVLFGDGAGAVVLRQVPAAQTSILSTTLGADGSYVDLLVIPAGGTRMPLTTELLEQHMDCIKMSGKEVFKLAVENMLGSCKQVLKESNLTVDDLRWLVPHQANTRIIQAIGKRLEIADEKVFVNLDKYGNTSAATIPIALDEIVRSGRVQHGDHLLLTAFGGGLTWGAMVLRW